MRLDANQSLSREAARALLVELAPLGVEFVEEPLAPGERHLESPAVPLALDESLRQGSRLDSMQDRVDEGAVV